MSNKDNRHQSYAMSDPSKLFQPLVLLIEDDLRMGGILSELLEDDYRVDWVTTAVQAREHLDMDRYDAAIVDRRLPDMDGLDFVRSARRRGITVPMLMLTALASTEDIVSGLDGGANDYLTKPFRFEELNARLRTMLRGYHAEMQSYDIGDWNFQAEKGVVKSPEGLSIQLTPAEVSLLRTMCIDPDRIFTRSELLRAAFRQDAVEGTVDAYVSYIRAKTTRKLIITVRSKGYCLGAPREGELT
ncbi:MAG: response regulator transcription factor [Bifidobacterium sp.]|uniref:Response regulator transcription factor n=1 Tax=Bifidobacterium fermentum TaxID=3059035 RepID=A0AB39UBZ7_9BIFI